MRAAETSDTIDAGRWRWLRDPATALVVILVAAFGLRIAWLSLPPGTLIFDEAYYVNAARILLGWAVEPGTPYAGATAGLDPNAEHPPLGKLLLAGSMLLFGDNGIGWRVPSVVAGMVSLGAIYRLVRSAGESGGIAVVVVALLAFENLTFVHGRLGMLDMLVLAPILVAAWLAMRESWSLAGVFLGLGFLVKTSAVFGLLAVLLLLAVRLAGAMRADRARVLDSVRAGFDLLLAFATVALLGLWLLDTRFTTFATPLDHLRHMIQFGVNLTSPTDQPGICFGISSTPWQWLVNTCQINYLKVDANVVDAAGRVVTVTPIDFRAALNPVLAGAIPLATLAAISFAWRTGDRLATWAVAWMAANYLPFVALVLLNGRVTYLYYFLPVIPGLAAAIAILLLRSGLPRFVTWGYLAAYAVGFAAYFPFRQIP